MTLATLLFSSTDLPTPAEFAVRQRRSFPDWDDDELEVATVGIIAAWQALPIIVRLYYVHVEPTDEESVDAVWCLDSDFLECVTAWSVDTTPSFSDYPAGLAMAAIAQQLTFLMAREPTEHVNETVMRYRDSFPMFETPMLQRLAFGAMAGIRLAVGMLRRSVTGDLREVIMHRSTWRRIMAKPYSV